MNYLRKLSKEELERLRLLMLKHRHIIDSHKIEFSPSLKSPCLCGSGKKYKRCCFEITKNKEIQIDDKIDTKIKQLFKQKDYKQALRFCRARYTAYAILYKSHTEPVLKNEGISVAKELVTIDILALSDIQERLMECYFLLGRIDEFNGVLEKQKVLMNYEGWSNRIIFLKTLTILRPNWDEEKGCKEIKKVKNIDSIEDNDILQLYLSLNANEIPVLKRIEMLDRIIKGSTEQSSKVFYTVQKAMYMYTLDQIENAVTILDDLIEQIDETDYDQDSFLLYSVALLYGLRGQLEYSEEYLNRSISIHKRRVNEDKLTEFGLAKSYRYLGDLYTNLSKWDEAKECYEKSQGFSKEEIIKAFIARIYLHMDQLEETKKILSEIDISRLHPFEYSDYLHIKAEASISSGNIDELEEIEKLLASNTESFPYFEKRKNELLIKLKDFRLESSQKKKKKIGIIRFINKYLMLKPNIIGFGFDFNRMIDDLYDIS